jgi:hypothetical protein
MIDVPVLVKTMPAEIQSSREVTGAIYRMVDGTTAQVQFLQV